MRKAVSDKVARAAEAAAALGVAVQGGRACIGERAARLGVARQRHAASANVQVALSLVEAARIAQAVDIDRVGRCAGHCCGAAGSVVEVHRHASRNHHIGHVGQVGHCTASPVGRVKPVACEAANPGRRAQAGHLAAGVVGQRDGVVGAIVAVADHHVAGREGFVLTHIFVVKAQVNAGDTVAGNPQQTGQMRQIRGRGGVLGLSVIHMADRLRCQCHPFGCDGAVGSTETVAAGQVVVGSIVTRQRHMADAVTPVNARMFAGESPLPADRDFVVGLQACKAQIHVAHGRCAVVDLAHVRG